MLTPRILIVEDEAVVAADLQDRLRSAGFDVEEPVASGERALEVGPRLLPDLVIMDIRLAGQLDGVDTARKLRDRMDVPVIFLTAFDDPAMFERARLVEPHAYLRKPFDERELVLNLHIALYRHNARQELARLREDLRFVLKRLAALRRLIPVCRHCKKIRDVRGVWQAMDEFLHTTAGIRVTHGYCRPCSDQILASLDAEAET